MVGHADGSRGIARLMAILDWLWPYAAMMGTAFLAATLVPLGSEVALIAAIKSGLGSPFGFLVAASIGNIAGCVFNWWLGLNLRRFEDRSWFPVTRDNIAAASSRFNRYGKWALLFSWVPFIGDPLTLVAGILGVPLRVFLPLVAIGRIGRYVVVTALAS